MKKTITFFGAILFGSTVLISCGSKEKLTLPDPPSDLKYEAVSLIDGPLAEYVEVIPGSYLLEFQKNDDQFLLGYDLTVKVKLKFIKPFDVKAGVGYNQYGPSLNGKALDEQGKPLDFELSAFADKDLATYLKRGSGEEWITLSVSGQGSSNNLADVEQLLEKYKKGKKLRLNSEIIEEKFESNNSSSTASTAESTSENYTNSTDNCDEFLNEYEKFMEKYIDVLKKYKSNPTDTSILNDYNSLMSEASKWSTKTADCASDAKFAAKYATIQMKIANAASSM